MFKKLLIWLNLFSLGLCAGCAPLGYYEKNLFEYQPKPVFSDNKRIDKVAGLNLFLDKRLEKKDTRELLGLFPGKHLYQSVQEIVTILLLEDFKKSNLFKEIHYPPQATDDIIIYGSINRFTFDSKETFLSRLQSGRTSASPLAAIFCPFLILPLFLGAPAFQEYCAIDISLEAKDNKTNMPIANLKESAKAEKGVSIFQRATGKALTNSFREVGGKFKKDLIKIKF